MSGYKYSGEMKVPTRAAPPPPTSAGNHSSWSSSIFGTKDKNSNAKGNQPKKKPPPRPPPPKFSNQLRGQDERHSHSQLVAGLFTRSHPKVGNENSGCLIDWTSPPSSPTSTTRSSSDALSVNSFGSDSATPSSGTASNVESGFEDDFELYGSQNSRNADPWSPPIVSKPAPSNTNWVTFSPNVSKKQIMPTIIRPKPERPKFPKVLEKKIEMDALAEVFQNTRIQNIPTTTADDEDDGWSSDSPPMPTCPPPAPPPELLAGFLEEAILSENLNEEIAIALYDYQGSVGDVSFSKGDRLKILRHVDEHWVEAEVNGRRGSAPVNHLEFESRDPQTVTALYAFNPETWEDLALEPGMQIRLMGRVNNDWLYGEANGKKGQFPANFISRVPKNLPQWTMS